MGETQHNKGSKMLSIKQATDISRQHGFSSLITHPTGNAKLAKSVGYYNCGISLAQASLSGHNMCSGSTPQCRAGCLGGTGRAEFTPAITKIRIARTKLFATNPELFWSILEPQLHAVDRKAAKLGVEVAFRPDILSDQPWHIVMPQLLETFPHWNFYGYTKVKSKITARMNGSNTVHQTYSWSERANLDYVRGLIRDGVNVAVPFYSKETMRGVIPAEWQGMKVIDGDKSDLRFLDRKGVIVGLTAKLPKSRAKAVKKLNECDGFFVGV